MGNTPKTTRAASVVLILALFLVPPALRGQFKPEEIAQREAYEKTLLTAEIVRFEEIGEGVTKPYKLFLNDEGREVKAAWKNPSGMMGGYLEGWQYEIAAYRLDKLIGLNMIPVAVEREFQGNPGALVLWAENKYSLLDLVEQGIRIPDSALDHTERMKYLTRAWDCLVANEDRTQQNVLYTEDWRMIIFDHSRAFRSKKTFTKNLMFGANGIKKYQDGNPILFRRLPRWFVEAVRSLTYEDIKTAVGPYLTDKEIEAVIIRRGLLLKEIEDMIKRQGENAVIYE